MIRLEHDDDRGRPGVEPLPDVRRVFRRRERVEQHDLAAGLDAGRGDHPLPPESFAPVRIRQAPDPESLGDVLDHAQIAPSRARCSDGKARASPRTSTERPSERRPRRRAGQLRERRAQLPAGLSQPSASRRGGVRVLHACVSTSASASPASWQNDTSGCISITRSSTSASAWTSRIFLPSANACCEIPCPVIVREISEASANVPRFERGPRRCARRRCSHDRARTPVPLRRSAARLARADRSECPRRSRCARQ